MLGDTCQDFTVLHRVVSFYLVEIGACGQVFIPLVGIFLQAVICQSHCVEQHQTALKCELFSKAVHQGCILQRSIGGHQSVISPDEDRVFLREAVVLKQEKLVLTTALLQFVEGSLDIIKCRLLVAKFLHHRRLEENAVGQTGFHCFLRINIVKHGLQIILILGIADIVFQHRAQIAEHTIFHVILISTESALVAEALHHNITAERRLNSLYLRQISLDGLGCILFDGELIAGCKTHGTEYRLGVNRESQIRLNRRTDDFLADITQTTVIVDNIARFVVIVNGINGQVASIRVVNQILTVSLTKVWTLGNAWLTLQTDVHSLIGHHVGTYATLMLSLSNS